MPSGRVDQALQNRSAVPPPVVSKWDGPLGTLMLPSNTGGTNWPGGALDPETNILYIYSFTNVVSLGLINDASRSDMDFGRGRAPDPKAAPATAKPGGGGGGGEEAERQLPFAVFRAHQAALRTHHGDRSRPGRDGMAGGARRYAGQRPQ